MGTTTRFGLSWFDDSESGALSDSGGKFTGRDRLLIDTLLATIEGHSHSLGATTLGANPVDDPVGTLLSTGGTLGAGMNYSYVVSFVDASGLETIAGPEITVETPDILVAPVAPGGTTDTDGSLPTGNYEYALTARRDTEESPLGDVYSVTLIAGDGSVDLTLPALGDATSLGIWRRKDTESGFTLLDEVSSTTYTDDGSVTAVQCPLDPNYAPPSSNTGVNTYAITVALGTTDATSVQSYAAWRIYRATAEGDYSAQSLVAEVTERVDELDPNSALVTTYTDLGNDLVTGQPLTKDVRMTFQPFVLDTQTPLPAATNYPVNYIISDGVALYEKIGTEWVALGSSSGGFTFEGLYDAAHTYAEGDVIRARSHLWKALAASPTAGPVIFEFALDNFNRANNADLGNDWLQYGGTFEISSNHVVVSYLFEAFANMGPAVVRTMNVDDQYVSCNYSYVSGTIGAVLYGNDAGTEYLGVNLDGTNVSLYQDGTLIAQSALALSAGTGKISLFYTAKDPAYTLGDPLMAGGKLVLLIDDVFAWEYNIEPTNPSNRLAGIAFNDGGYIDDIQWLSNPNTEWELIS
jgi:hypothetical protein